MVRDMATLYISLHCWTQGLMHNIINPWRNVWETKEQFPADVAQLIVLNIGGLRKDLFLGSFDLSLHHQGLS